MSKNHNKTPKCITEVNPHESTEIALDQLSILKRAFFECPGTMLMIARQTGIERASICRRISTLRENKLIDIVRIDYCKISHSRAAYYSTDMSKYFGISQLSLF